MKKINSIEDALLLFEENTIKSGEALSADDLVLTRTDPMILEPTP